MSLNDSIRRATSYWDLRVGSQYTIAYNEAYNNYQKVLKEDEEDRRARAEMMVAIASIMSTSVLMAVAAYGPMRRLAARSALRTLGMRNTRAVLDLFAKDSTTPILSFAMGKAIDIVKGKANEQMKGIANRLLQDTASGISRVNPTSRGEEVRQIIGFQGLAVEEWAEALTANRQLSVGERETALRELLRSPFMTYPAQSLEINRLQPRLELGFYMQHILDTDYTVRHGPIGARMPPQRGGGISALPSDRANYPRNESATAMSFYTTVEIDRPSFRIQEKIDELHREIYGEPFYTVGRHLSFWQSSSGKAEELIRAENTLRNLSARTRPQSVQAVRVA